MDHARRLARRNVAILAEAVRQGYHVVATEPAAALCLVHEYPQLLDDDDARLLAANASEACTFLWKMHTLGTLQLDLRPINAVLGYHAPCHLKALGVGLPGVNLLSLIPGLRVHHIERGCSGMAGTFGLLHKNYRSSLRAGWGLISRLRDPALQAGVTECSACKIQMEQGTTKPTIHPDQTAGPLLRPDARTGHPPDHPRRRTAGRVNHERSTLVSRRLAVPVRSSAGRAAPGAGLCVGQ